MQIKKIVKILTCLSVYLVFAHVYSGDKKSCIMPSTNKKALVLIHLRPPLSSFSAAQSPFVSVSSVLPSDNSALTSLEVGMLALSLESPISHSPRSFFQVPVKKQSEL